MHDEFQASVCWLNKFQSCYRTISEVVCSEENTVPAEKISNLHAGEFFFLIASCSLNDVLNGLNRRFMSCYLIHLMLEVCFAIEISKLMVALFCCNACCTEKMRPLALAILVSPQCFRHAHLPPCDYQANIQAQRMKDLFNDWLRIKGAK